MSVPWNWKQCLIKIIQGSCQNDIKLYTRYDHIIYIDMMYSKIDLY